VRECHLLKCKLNQNFIQYQVYKSRVKYESMVLTHGERERNVSGFVDFIIYIMVVFHLLTFIESNLQRREYHFVNS